MYQPIVLFGIQWLVHTGYIGMMPDWCPVNLLCQTCSCSLHSNDDFSILLWQPPWEYSCVSTHIHHVHEMSLTHSPTTASDTQHRESVGVRHESFHAQLAQTSALSCCLADMSCCWAHQLLDAQSRSYWHPLFMTHRACPPFEPLNGDFDDFVLFSLFSCFSHMPAWYPSLAHVVDLMSSLPDLWIMFPSCSMHVTYMTIVPCMSRATACIFLMTLIEFLFTRAWETYTCVVLTALVHWSYYCLLAT